MWAVVTNQQLSEAAGVAAGSGGEAWERRVPKWNTTIADIVSDIIFAFNQILDMYATT